MYQSILDPSQVSRRSRLDPLRCYLSLRKTVEPHWYRSFWQRDPWADFFNHDLPVVKINCSEEEKEMLRGLDDIPSAVNQEQTQVLYWLARHCPAAGDIVEIGSDQAKSTIALGWGAGRNESPCAVHAVDPFPGGVELTSSERIGLFKDNLARFGSAGVILHQMSSGDYRRERQSPLRLLFVDAAHDYLNSSYDFLAWRDLISPGGFIVAHDVDNYSHGPGTRRAFMDCVLKDSRYRLVCHLDNMAVARMVSAKERSQIRRAV